MGIISCGQGKAVRTYYECGETVDPYKKRGPGRLLDPRYGSTVVCHGQQLPGFYGTVALTLRVRIPHRVGRFEPGYPGGSLRVPTDEWLLIDRSEDVSPAECWPQYVQT